MVGNIEGAADGLVGVCVGRGCLMGDRVGRELGFVLGWTDG